MKHARPDYNRIQDPAGKIPADEPVFLLRGQDEFAPRILRAYANELMFAGIKGEIVDLTFAQADAMDRWQKEHGRKRPDLPPGFDPAVTARLEDARPLTPEYGNWPCIDGIIYDDAKGRFRDGYRIRWTSRVVKIEGDIVHTTFSLYRVKWREGVDVEAFKKQVADWWLKEIR